MKSLTQSSPDLWDGSPTQNFKIIARTEPFQGNALSQAERFPTLVSTSQCHGSLYPEDPIPPLLDLTRQPTANLSYPRSPSPSRSQRVPHRDRDRDGDRDRCRITTQVDAPDDFVGLEKTNHVTQAFAPNGIARQTLQWWHATESDTLTPHWHIFSQNFT